MAPTMHDSRAPMPHNSHPIATQSKSKAAEHLALFGDLPEAKKPKFIAVDDPAKKQRVRVRTTLDTVNTEEIPDSWRKSTAVYPRSWFPTQMQDPPPSAGYFADDDADSDDAHPRARRGRTMVPVALATGPAEVAIPRMRRGQRAREVSINELGYRMSWHQNRTFDGKPVFLQKARESPLLPPGPARGR
jgi:hypothetical protein